MKQLVCTSKNLSSQILGRISLKKSFFSAKDVILVTRENISSSKYAAIITDDKSKVCSNKPVLVSNDLELFHEGDVVTVDQNGLISFVYEINAKQNVILATEKCNHRCIMCPQPPIEHENSRLNFNLKLISLIDKNSKEIGISGGEPTVIGDDLFVILKALRKRCKNTAITILSNGVLFANKAYAEKLALCGLKDLQVDVPIFSDIASIHNDIVGAKTFYKSVQGLYNLALFGIKVGIRVVVMKQNYKRLPNLSDYIYHNFSFVSQVAFMQMEFEGLARENFEKLWIDPFDYSDELKEAVLLLNDRGLVPYIYNAQLCVLPHQIREFAVQSISEWKDIYISECENCKAKGLCAGFFASNMVHHSRNIISFTTDNL